MVTRKDDTSKRVARRKYEEKNKELRKEKNANFQTMIPRELFEEINTFLTEKGMTKVDFIKKAYEIMKKEGMSLDSVVFVTNGYHVYRAASYAKDEGFLEVAHLGTDIIWYTIPMNYMREMMAVVKMWVFD